MIPLYKVHLPKGVEKKLKPIFESGYISEGPQAALFQTRLQEWIGNPYVALTNSCTSAITIALRLADVGPGSKVITSPQTCLATNEPILIAGAKPVWCDIDPETGNIDPSKIAELITKKTKAILFVDWAGTPAELDEINSIAHEYGLKTIEDAAHAFGAKYKGKKVGTICDFTTFSFQAIKHFSTVDGGAIACLNQEDFDRAVRLRWFGLDRGHNRSLVQWEGDVLEPGYKCVHALTRVRTSTTKSRRIMGIVNNKEECIVDTLDKHGNIVQKKVTGWYKNNKGNRRWAYLTHEFSAKRNKYKQFDRNYGDNEGVFLTEDHPILTLRGYIPVNKITNNDLLVTASPDLTKEQMEFITGTMLGDGCISMRENASGSFSVTHSAKQSEWINIQKDYLSSFDGKISNYKVRDRFPMMSYQSTISPVWTKLRNRFYKDRTKILPENFSYEHLSPRALATWYMDDGSLNHKAITFCTDNFTKREVNILVDAFNKLGYETNVYLHEKKYYRIGISTKSSDKLFTTIAAYIPNQMRYKLPLSKKIIPFDPSLWKTPKCQPRLKAKPIIYYLDPPTRAEHKVYCIDVEETHNFIVGGDIVIHNCHMNDINATIGLEQLKYIDANLAKHKENGIYFQLALNRLHNIDTTNVPSYIDSSYWIFTIRLKDAKHRAYISKKLVEAGIGNNISHTRNDTYSLFKDFRRDLPGLDDFSSRMLNIPCGWWVTKEQRDYIVQILLDTAYHAEDSLYDQETIIFDAS